MKAMLLVTGSGALTVLTSFETPTTPAFLARLENKGIDKFIAHEIPIDLARARYGAHFDVVAHGLHESDDLRVLDYNGDRAFKLFGFSELGPVIEHESEEVKSSRLAFVPTTASSVVRSAEDLQ